MTITALPTPPSRSAPSTFSPRMDALLAALPAFVSEANALAVALNLASTTATSTTSLAIGTGSKSLTVDTAKSYQVGMSVKIAYDSTNWMHGEVTSYDSGTGALVVNVTAISGSGTYSDWTVTLSGPIAETILPTGHLSGLTLSHAADTEHDITVAAGAARDATDAADMTLPSAITKRFDAEWTVGTGNGGMAAGESLPTSGTIHIWLIMRSDTGIVDVMANDHATSGLTPTLPSGYDYKRRIFSLRTDPSANIFNGAQWGTGKIRRFRFSTPPRDISVSSSASGDAATGAMTVPAGVDCVCDFNVMSDYGVYLSSLYSADMACAEEAAPMLSNGMSGTTRTWGYVGGVVSNTLGQIRYRPYGAGVKVFIVTLGWEDSL